MDARRPCPDTALLAAYLDHALTGYEREAVIAHLADCPQCRAIAVTVVEFREVAAHDASWDGGQASTPRTPRFVSGVARWSRAKTRAPARALAAAVVLAAIAIPIFLLSRPAPPAVGSSSPQHAVSTLIEVAERQRPVEARLSGAVAYAPPPTLPRPVEADAARIRLITTASQIRSAYAHDYGAPSRRAIGVAALVTGDLDEAIATLEVAAAGAPEDVEIANDLAAAYYERAQRADRPDDLPAALSAVESVLHAHPAHLQALFNRALIITALGLRAEAEAAWQTYIARDGASPWTAEARQRLAAVPALVRSDWASVRDAFDHRPDERQARRIVKEHTSAAHDFVENILLNRWLTAAKQKDAATSDQTLAKIRLLAEAFAAEITENIYRDFVVSVDRARQQGHRAFAKFVIAHDAFAAAMRLMREQRFQQSVPLMARAADQLVSVNSPLSTRALVEHAALDYVQMRYHEAAEQLSRIKHAAIGQRYLMLAARAAWIQGLTAYALKDFATSQLAYEELLTSAAATGDADQWLWAAGLLANLHDTLGDERQAWRYRIDAAMRSHEAFSPATRNALLASAAGDAAMGGHHDAALLIQSVLLRAVARPSASVEAQVRSLRARSLIALNRRAEAEHEVSVARQRLTTVLDEASRLRLEADVLMAEAEVYRESNPLRAAAAAEQALSLPIAQRDLLRRARLSLALAEALREGRQTERAEHAVTSGLQGLEQYRAIPSAEFSIRASDAVWSLYALAAENAIARGDLSAAFAHTERGRVRTAQERRTWGAQTTSLQDLQASLKADAGVTVLTQIRDRLHVWLIRRNSVASHVVEMTPAHAAGLVASHLHEMVHQTALPPTSAQLFEVIFRPLATDLIGVDRLIVVADAPYNRVAFAGLWDAQRDRYLVEDYGIVVAPSATAFTWTARRSPTPARSSIRQATVLSAFVAAPNSGGLSDRVQATYGGSPIGRETGISGTRFARSINAADVVHVSTTLVPNDRFPSLSRVEFTRESGRRLSAESLLARALPDGPARAQLVSFEQTVTPSIRSKGDGSLAFARDLIAAGVPAVVSPVAEIALASVEQTWIEFHRNFAAGNTAADSLRRAQIEALGDSNRRPGPWATLTVFGSEQ